MVTVSKPRLVIVPESTKVDLGPPGTSSGAARTGETLNKATTKISPSQNTFFIDAPFEDWFHLI
jgi:hypothetical protein